MQVSTIGNGKDFLYPSQLQALPSLNATREAATLSDRYKFIPTMNVIETLAKHDWFPVSAQEQRVRTLSRVGFQKHMVRFRQTGIGPQAVGDVLPEIVLTNSHDGFTKYNFMLGLFRMACLNGLIVSEATFASIKIMHVGYEEKDVLDASYRVIEDVPKITERVKEYRAIPLNPKDRETFAESALILRYARGGSKTRRDGANFWIDDRTFNLPALLGARREEDRDSNLWNTYNIVQEKMTKGNAFERTTREINGRVTHRRKVQGITGIDAGLQINRGLWHLMDKMAELKGAAA
jgi:hypothetical protein